MYFPATGQNTLTVGADDAIAALRNSNRRFDVWRETTAAATMMSPQYYYLGCGLSHEMEMAAVFRGHHCRTNRNRSERREHRSEREISPNEEISVRTKINKKKSKTGVLDNESRH